MKRQTVLMGVIAITALLVGGGCATPREAAVIGSFVGRQIGTPLGAAVVAVEETFNSAGDVRQANPRYDKPVTPTIPTTISAPRQVAMNTAADNSTHYYRAEVIVRTRGPAAIEALDLRDTQDVTAFWGK